MHVPSLAAPYPQPVREVPIYFYVLRTNPGIKLLKDRTESNNWFEPEEAPCKRYLTRSVDAWLDDPSLSLSQSTVGSIQVTYLMPGRLS